MTITGNGIAGGLFSRIISPPENVPIKPFPPFVQLDWEYTYSAASATYANVSAVQGGAGCVSGWQRETDSLKRFAANGTELWNSYSTSPDLRPGSSVYGVATDEGGSAYTVVYAGGAIHAAQHAPDGTVLWTRYIVQTVQNADVIYGAGAAFYVADEVSGNNTLPGVSVRRLVPGTGAAAWVRDIGRRYLYRSACYFAGSVFLLVWNKQTGQLRNELWELSGESGEVLTMCSLGGSSSFSGLGVCASFVVVGSGKTIRQYTREGEFIQNVVTPYTTSVLKIDLAEHIYAGGADSANANNRVQRYSPELELVWNYATGQYVLDLDVDLITGDVYAIGNKKKLQKLTQHKQG